VLASAIKQALQNYNTLALVKPLSTLQSQRYTVACSAASGGRLDHLVAVQASGAAPGLPALYARAASPNASSVYGLTVDASGSRLGCGSAIDSSVVDLTTDGSQLYLLHEDSATNFSVEQVTPVANAKPQVLLTLPSEGQNVLPTLLAVHGTLTYVLYRGAKDDSVYVCSNTPPAGCHTLGPAPLPVQAYSMTVAPNGQLYFLLVDGSIGVLSPTGTLHPATLNNLLPVLSVSDPNAFNPLSSVPTVPAPPTFSSTPTATPGTADPYTPTGVKLPTATVLVSDQHNRLFIGDGADHRVIRLDAPSTGATDPLPSQQYADASALDSLQSVSAIDQGDNGFALYVLGNHSLLVITLP
jgi:hypothetical protein